MVSTFISSSRPRQPRMLHCTAAREFRSDYFRIATASASVLSFFPLTSFLRSSSLAASPQAHVSTISQTRGVNGVDYLPSVSDRY
ncbi:hypothetical protein GALMADRAFT_717899 [Galerina marginata CBS 339.88]|uniref:Uncharacterized protein n=1 Tax=Galerina marginata (strain CBS 339.88) TaxID=685588 RepID=A0A067TN37_GALM3|nr:hypothetical protein GALMADRAFT_717899 [Galerina marginata CBS 339.88]